jgi:hypothetical protein
VTLVRAESRALRTLVAGVVDYAGLFPPASLPMDDAVANYATYRASDDAWMLGRFVVPVVRLAEWSDSMSHLPPDDASAWHGARLSALLSGEFAREAEQMAAFNAQDAFGVQIDVAEGRVHSPDAVLALAAALPDDVMLYCEVPHRDDPAAMLQAVHTAGVRAKIRTGGVTPDAFPTPVEVTRFLRRCHEFGVTAKATAGLHHPLRGDYRLTYAPNAVRGTMYGYLNVFLAAAAIGAGLADEVATSILLSTDPVQFDDDAVRVAGVSLSAAVLRAARCDSLVAFGSCSFREPVDELPSALVR